MTMRVVSEVARLGSFTAAARALRLSTPSISRLIGEQEADLDVRLFNRTTRRVALTEAGEQFLRRSNLILEELDALREDVRERHGQPRGRLRVSCVVAFGTVRLAPAIAGFLERYPGMEVELDITNRQADLVEEHYDLAFRISSRGELADSSLIARQVFAQKLIFVAAPEYLRQHLPPQTLDDLKIHRLITHVSGEWGRVHRLKSPGGIVEYRGARKFVVSSPMAVRNAALTGYGCALVNDFIVTDPIAAGRLVRILPEYESIEQPIYAVYPHRTHVPAKTRLFLDYLVKVLGGAAP